MKKAALHNLGCKVNAYETEAMQQLLEEAGYEITAFEEKADVYVVNTCSVTNIADRKSRQMLHRARRKNPDAVIVAAGCYVQAAAQDILKEGIADIVLGNNKKNRLIQALEEFAKSRRQAVEWEDINAGAKEYEPLSAAQPAGHTRAFVKIQDGCNQFCSYCIIPYARGRVRSRALTDVLAEVRALAENGCKEVVLTGIHLSSYGTDFVRETKENQRSENSQLKSRRSEDMQSGSWQPENMQSDSRQPEDMQSKNLYAGSLLSLIRKIHEIEGIVRIRLGSLEPGIITEEFAAALAGMEKICPHFHLSLQSGCDTVLKRMNRRYKTAEYAQRCEILRRHFVNPAVTTDVITGFPGETEAEFEETRRFLKQMRFYDMHIFKYSKRKGTKAAGMDGQVPEAVKAARSAQLIALAADMSEEYRRGLIGKEQSVLLEEPFIYEGKTYYAGYTKEYVKTAVESSTDRKNSIASGKITGHLTRDMYLMVEF